MALDVHRRSSLELLGHRKLHLPDLGDVHDDDDKFIVDIGTKHHTHFHGSRYPDASDISGAAIDAVRFVSALISDGVCVTVDYLDGRCIGSSHFFLDTENLTPDTVHRSRTGIRGGNIHMNVSSGPVLCDADGWRTMV